MSLSIELGKLISEYDVSPKDFDKVQELEEKLQEAVNNYQRATFEGELDSSKVDSVIVADALYDRGIEIIKELAPNSPLAKEIWETQIGEEVTLPAEFQELLDSDTMKSIETIKSYGTMEFNRFETKIKELGVSSYQILTSLKLNGWGVQLYYKHGILVKAYSRARASKGLDLTEMMTQVLEKDGLTFIPALKDIELCSIRGECNLLNERLEEARKFNPNIAHPLSAINSIRSSRMPAEARQLLSFHGYRYIEHDFEFATRQEEYEFISSLGFETPINFLIEVNDDLPAVVADLALDHMASLQGMTDYYSDGVVLQVNSNELYKKMGSSNRVDFGAVALKMGYWEQKDYYGYVQMISWESGKSKLTPVAIVADEPDKVEFNVNGVSYKGFFNLAQNCEEFEDIKSNLIDYVTNYQDLGVVTAVSTNEGNTVRRVPVYNIYAMIELGIKPNSILNFKYGGESAVVPIDSKGNLYKGI